MQEPHMYDLWGHARPPRRQHRTHQGVSALTPRKEFEIEGVTQLRFTQFKSRYFLRDHPRVLCADVFSGSGANDVLGETVDGSPLRILNGYRRANNRDLDVAFWFSDIRLDACRLLAEAIQARDYHLHAQMSIRQVAAADAIDTLHATLNSDPSVFLYLVLDPNGPKDFPRCEVEALLRSHSKRVDIVPNISATAVNRCIGARKAGIQFKRWLANIENFDEGFVSRLASGRQGWIRQPVQSDPQRWTIIPTFGKMPPKGDWRKQGFVPLNSKEGRDAVRHYCGGINGNGR